ncbi:MULTISPECIES: MFS transporter [unclassified Novosphingobium]|uniref:MFS transporter n=1 Tax=unclassified Novosphingobium TaxID=2644732 RepID=UPI00144123DA|nr:MULTISPECIES: MFS transporter [unclassified Novosphingobium]MBB3357180.1 MFS family permease [Novosphingobium sp. BK256]MBB3374158.1 MFS family permease [Novosphingobium sp. BK280]MBB3378570.1 MFS family permease [Novosphingobium sp. BK258]MBB3419646.1 MFS family permease [Novosphingobium sp. BK267]MBB3448033.1 MFS family permease [Novosphingobium sp. BK352]
MEFNTAIEGMAQAERGTRRLTPAGQISAVLVGLIGAFVIFVTPGFLAVIAQKTGFDNDQLGYLAAFDINAMGVTIGLSTFLLARVPWRLAVSIGLALVIAGNILTALATGFAGMAAARVVAGAGEGIAVGFAFAALGRAANPDRAFSIYLVVGALCSSALLYSLPALQAAVSPATLFLANALVVVPVALGVRWFPEGSIDETDIFAGAGRLDMRLASGALLGVFLFFFALGAMWSYSERIGMAHAIAPGVIATGLSIGTMAGVAGAALAGMLPRRWGRVWPLLLSGAAGVISFLMFDGRVEATGFVVAVVLLQFCWNFAQPLLSGICAEACLRGRVVCAMGSIQTFGTGLGPAAAAATLASGSFAPMIYANSAILAASIAVTVLTIRAERRRRPA